MANDISRVYFDDPAEEVEVPVKVKNQGRKPKSQIEALNPQQERQWAAIAHAMAPTMVAAVVLTDGFAWLGAILVTLGIYLHFGQKSAFVREQAQQALVVQVLGSLGWLTLIIGGTVVFFIAFTLSLALILVLVGLVLAPLVGLAYTLYLLALMLLPPAVAVMGAWGAYQVWNGQPFRYPYVSEWLERRLARKAARPLPPSIL